jgi:hypothetical protein
MRPDEVVIAPKQLQVIFETLLPSSVAYRPPKKIGRAPPDRQIQPFDERRVQFRGVLGVAQHLFQSPRVADQRSSLDLDDAVVPTRLDDLAVQTRWPKDANDSFFVKCESVRHDQRDTFEIHSTRYISQEDEGVSVASSPYDSRRPRPDVNRGEDPDQMFFVSDNRLKLVCLKLHDGECSYFSIVEPTTKGGCLFKPAIDGIPGDPLYSGDSRLVQTLDAECGNFIEGRATVLESIVRRTGFRAECFSATPAQISTTLRRASLVEAVANDASETPQLAQAVSGC